MELSAKEFFSGHFSDNALHLHEPDWDIGGGKLTTQGIDELAKHPDAECISISGLRQDTFEYLIRTFGPQLKAICFFKNKLVEDWSLLGTLPKLEYVYWFGNQRIDRLWDMHENQALKGLLISDFSRLHSIEGIEKARALRYFSIGNAIWSMMAVDSLMPLAKTKITDLEFFGRKISDGDLSFFSSLHDLQSFNCALNLFPTEQYAWIAANCPKAEGRALHPKEDGPVYVTRKGGPDTGLPGTYIIGKRKPALTYEGNEAKIQKYVDSFERMKKEYRGIPFKEAFPDK